MKRYREIIIGAVMAVVAMVAGAGEALAQSYDLEGYTIQSQRRRIYTEWGIGIAGVYTGMYELSTTDVRISPRFGFQGHVEMSVCFGRNFAIETEISYEGGTMDVATEDIEHRIRTRTLDIPVLLSLRMAGGRIRLSAGPQFTVLSKGEYTEGGDVRLYGPVSPTWNVAAALGIGLSRNFILEARYIHSLDGTYNQFGGKESTPGIEFESRPYRITAGLTLLF